MEWRWRLIELVVTVTGEWWTMGMRIVNLDGRGDSNNADRESNCAKK
jgi:hypothetical protein